VNARDEAAPADIAEGIREGDRRALARGITLVESARPDHQQQAADLLDRLLPDTGKALRIGISGAPGVGKSTFIEVLGTWLLTDAPPGTAHRVAVLAVDPSSARSGGSILGDKTRMEELSRHPEAYIRPSPAGTTLGGVARRTREAMLLCEAAGFDVVFVETVGVGQSETAVADLVDLFAVLVAPGGGDELQGIKRGIMELADLVIVNKADGDLEAAARRAEADYRNALHLLRPKWEGWSASVLTCSAVERRGIAEAWAAMVDFAEAVRATGELAELRRTQADAWMWSEIDETLVEALRADPQVQATLAQVEPAVLDGRLSPTSAARQVLSAFHQP
jgi:LAO/AO transport system kinase